MTSGNIPKPINHFSQQSHSHLLGNNLETSSQKKVDTCKFHYNREISP